MSKYKPLNAERIEYLRDELTKTFAERERIRDDIHNLEHKCADLNKVIAQIQEEIMSLVWDMTEEAKSPRFVGDPSKIKTFKA